MTARTRFPVVRLLTCALVVAFSCRAADLDALVRASWSVDDPLAQLAREVRAHPDAFSNTDLAIRVAKEIFPELDEEGAKAFAATLDGLAARLREPLAKAQTIREKATLIGELLYEKLELRTAGNEVPEKELPQHYFPHAVLKGKRGVCLGFTMLYLCLAERLDLPLVAAHAPQHIFIKWPDGENTLSIETTTRGRINTEADFRSRFRLTDEEIAKNGYFEPVGRLSVLGDLLNGASWFSAIGTAGKKLSPDRAVLAAQLCVAIEPRNFNNWDTLAQAYAYAGEHELALAALEKTVELRTAGPIHGEGYWTDRLKRFKEAAKR